VKAAAERGASLIVANGRPTKLDSYATEILRYNYGEENAVVQGIDLTSAANAVIFFGYEGMSLDHSAVLANTCAELLIKTGHVGKTNNGLVGVWPRANDQGAWDMGIRPIGDLKAAIEAAKVLYIVAADPAGDDVSVKELLVARNKLPDKLTVVQDLFLTETARLADLVLPVHAPTEREGTLTSGERRVQRFYPVVHPKGNTKADFKIAAMIGASLGLNLKGEYPLQVFSQICDQVIGYSGLTYQKLAEVTDQWPIMGRDDLFFGGTGYANKQGLGVQLGPDPGPTSQGHDNVTDPTPSPGERDSEDNGIIGIPVTKLYDQGVMMQPSKLLDNRLTKPFIAMNPIDAQTQKTTDGMTVNVSVNGASAPAVVEIDENVPAGYALIPRSLGIPVVEPVKIIIRIAETFTA
jgi:NADH-quinone oxidoreductase subunit G